MHFSALPSRHPSANSVARAGALGTARPGTARLRTALLRTAALGAAALGAACSNEPDGSAPTGVLLISIDSLRADHVSSYGYRSATAPDQRTTPFIDDRIAKEGTRFANVYSTTSWTLPAHMALLTGQPNQVHGVRDTPWQLETKVQPYLPKIFREAGWTTFGIWSGPNLHPYFGFGEGFEAYVDCSEVVATTDTFTEVTDGDWQGVQAAHNASHRAVTGPKIVDAFMKWFDGIGPDESFFAFVHMWDVHYDYHPPKAFDVFYPGYVGSIESVPFQDLNGRIKHSITREDRLRLLSLYDAELRYTDANIERMVDELESAGRLDDTLVVVVSDHGEEFDEHGNYGHKINVFEESVRIPLLFRHPGTVLAGGVLEGVTSITDVAPTILDVAGLAVSPRIWGRSLRSSLEQGVELPERLAPMELTFRNKEWYRAARGANEKWIEVTADRREAFSGYNDDGLLSLANFDYLSAKVPAVVAAIHELPQGEIEGDPARVEVRRVQGLPKFVREIAVGPNDPFARQVHRLWREIAEVEGLYAEHRKRGIIDEAVMASLAAAGYVDLLSGAESEGGATSKDGAPGTTGSDAAGPDGEPDDGDTDGGGSDEDDGASHAAGAGSSGGS